MIDIYKIAKRHKLSESEENVLKYIVNNTDKVLELGVRGVARECFSSSSVVMNLAKKMGYRGFIEMVYKLEENFKEDDVAPPSNDRLCLNLTDELLEEFKGLLLTNRSKPMYVHAVGFSSIVSKYIQQKLMVEGFLAMESEYFSVVDKERKNETIFIFISKSGETPQILDLAKQIKQGRGRVISFVGAKDSGVEEHSDLTFVVKNSNRNDDRNIQENDFFGNVILFFESLIYKTLS